MRKSKTGSQSKSNAATARDFAAALQNIERLRFDRQQYRGYFYRRLRERCEAAAEPLGTAGYLLHGGAKNAMRVFESGPDGEKWYTWFNYYNLCYLSKRVPPLSRPYLKRILSAETGPFANSGQPYYDELPDIRYERAAIIHALAANYPRSSPYHFLMHGLAHLAARPGFYAPSFPALFYGLLDDQDYQLLLATAGLFFHECAAHGLHSRVDGDFAREVLEVIQWLLARPKVRAG